MIHQGQEFGRSKVIAKSEIIDPAIGLLDHNSYEKDNETNWLNFEHKTLNQELFNYYKGLIRFRKKYPTFRAAEREEIQFIESTTQPSVGFFIPQNAS